MTINKASGIDLALTLQKNKLDGTVFINTLKTNSEVTSLWTAPANASCSISEWYFSSGTTTDTTKLASSDVITIRLQQPGRTIPIDPLQIDLKYEAWDVLTESATMQIFIGTGDYKVLYGTPIKVTYTINCNLDLLSKLFTL
jgi:hypothetical protein